MGSVLCYNECENQGMERTFCHSSDAAFSCTCGVEGVEQKLKGEVSCYLKKD